jgi:hypothetical protein
VGILAGFTLESLALTSALGTLNSSALFSLNLSGTGTATTLATTATATVTTGTISSASTAFTTATSTASTGTSGLRALNAFELVAFNIGNRSLGNLDDDLLLGLSGLLMGSRLHDRGKLFAFLESSKSVSFLHLMKS